MRKRLLPGMLKKSYGYGGEILVKPVENVTKLDGKEIRTLTLRMTYGAMLLRKVRSQTSGIDLALKI